MVFEYHNFVITGSSGYLGSHFLDLLKSEGSSNSIAYKNLTLLNRENFLSNVNNDNQVCIHIAYCKDLELEKAFLDQLDPETYLVFFSSSAVYGEANEPVSEASEAKPISDYGAYKLELEQYIQARFKKHLILRIANPFGKEPDTRGITRIMEERIAKNQEITLNQDEDKSIVRDFIYIDDLCQAILALLHEAAEGIFNISSGEAMSLDEVLSTLSQGQEIKIQYQGFKQGDIKYSVLDNSKILEACPGITIRSFRDLYEV